MKTCPKIGYLAGKAFLGWLLVGHSGFEFLIFHLLEYCAQDPSNFW